ncbi:eIF4a [Salpingoeca rosetta]|uniref:ATP-dependent RNA helicase n=1 Tax=Salpingoeca rosetta (strain ATCC 50818 / BSB-021) TaxID=946362 RepID=F2UFD8_SALR5|nr:eIF4a [Salpingoeca rosetta]EGD75338.1 eIF4a [Salpingoeca rosetta]|eukprot:XP_004992391.1 eIF4a [Salpingoeca rosetta]
MAAFDRFGMMPEIMEATQHLGWELPTDIQAEAVPLILGGGDVLMAAETGSGKTGAFCMPVIQIVAETLRAGTRTSTAAATAAPRRAGRMSVATREANFAVSADGLLCQSRAEFQWQGGRGELAATKGAVVKNGVYLGDAYEIPSSLRGQPLFPACTVKNAELKFNFGAQPFKHSPQGGFKAMNNQPDANVTTATAAGGASDTWKKSKGPVALILEPSRELAEQTRDQIRALSSFIKDVRVRDCLMIGGTNARDQLKALERGVDVVVGTPGRIEDFVKTGKLDLNRVRFFIVDEVDALLSQGHEQLLERLYNKMPKQTAGNRLQMVVCSATLHSPAVKKLADKLMYHPVWVDLKGLDSVPDTVHHVVVRVDPNADKSWQKKPAALRTDGVHAGDNTRPANMTAETTSEAIKILKFMYTLKAIDAHNMEQVIVFCRTRLDCDNLEKYLQAQDSPGPAHKYPTRCLHGSRGPERRQNLEAFKNGEARILICTDVAARGIDITGIPYVINVTLPDEKENYVHRIGRVGRADRMGLAISLVATTQEKVWYHTCPSKGKGCHNTRLKSQGGCTIWYDEPQLLADIQEHLGVVIPTSDASFKIERSEFDGKVVYGEKRNANAYAFKGHADLLAPSVAELSDLEARAQTSFLELQYKGTARV